MSLSLAKRGQLARAGTRNRLPRLPCSRVVARASQQVNVQRVVKDPFVDAVFRLQGLLHAVGDGEDELINNQMREEPPMLKLGLMALGGGALSLVAVLISSLAGQEPWGGASFSLHSLQCALIGAALAIPPVAARAYLWSPEAAEQLPPLGDMHRLKAEEAEPFLSQYNKGHVLVHAVLEIIPVALLLLPAAQGGLSAGLEFYSSLLQQSLFGSGAAAAAAASTMEAAAGGGAAGAAVPGGLGALLALIITATCTGVVQSWEIATDEEQVEVVKDAVQNADRYYRLTAMQVGSSPQDAARASKAFKAVAVSWMESREDACALSGAIAFLDVVMLSGIWHATGDLSAAIAAGLAIAIVDYSNLHDMAGGGKGSRAPSGDATGQSG